MSDEADATMEVVPSTTQKGRQEQSFVEFNLHACYYSDLFLLRTSIYTAVNGTLIEMKLAEVGSPYIHNPEIKTGIPLSQYSQLVSRVLLNHGVYHTDTFYYEEAPLFKVVFRTQDHIKTFLSKTDLVQSELEDETTNKVFCRKLLAFQDSSYIYIKSELFLVTPTHCECTQKEKEPEVYQLTIDNFCEHISKWKESKVFDFRHEFFTAVRVADESRKLKDEVVFKEVFKELRCVFKWFELGIHLDIPNFDLQAIRADYRTTPECRLEMLMLWEKLEKPTWRKLIVALTNIGEKQLAKKLATKHGFDISTSISDSYEELQRNENSSCISPQYEQDILSKQISIANHQQVDIQNELSERKTEFILLQEKVQKLSADFLDVKTQLDNKIEEMEVIQQSKRLFKSKNFKAAKERLLRGNEEQIESLKSKLKKKEEELEKAKQMLEKKEKELEEKTKELNAKCEETRQLKYEMSKMQQEFNSKEKEMFDKLAEMGIHSETQKKLMDQIKAQLDVAIKETSTKNAEIDTCIKKLSDKNELICKLSENIDTKEREMKSLQERLKSQTEAEEFFQQEREQQLHSIAIIIVERNLELERIKDEKMQLTLELNKAKELQRQETFVKQLSDKFTMQYESFEKWLTQGEELVSQDISSYSFQECEVCLTELQNLKQSLKQKEKEFNVIENLGKILPGESEEDESKQITEKLGALEQRWHSLITQRIRESTNKTIFVVLDLVKYYPQKLTLIDSITIRKVGIDKCTDPKQLYRFILQKIKAYDYRCRGNMLQISGHSVNQSISVSDNEFFDSDDSDNEITPLMIHPMDGLLALIHCADDFLRQDLMARLVTCQLSIPLVLPDPFTTELTFILWGLRTIVKEWKSTLQNATEIHECPLISYKAPIVSFVRFGIQTKSKSKIMNDVISDMDHNHFFHRDCKGGKLKCLLGDGLIELCWYLPAGRRNDIFPDLIAFLNLHGNAKDHPKQTAFLQKISFMIFAFITEDDLCNETTETLKQLSAAPGGVVLCTTSKPSTMKHLTQHIPDKLMCINLSTKNADEVKKEMREKILKNFYKLWSTVRENTKSLEECSEIAKEHGINVDESKDTLVQGQKKAQELLMMLTQHHDKDVSVKEKMFSLQGRDLWQKWATLEKEEHQQVNRGGMKIEEYSSNILTEKNKIRKLQLQHVQNDLGSLMESFIESLLTTSGSSRSYYLQNLKLYLNNLSQKTIASLRHKYIEKRRELLRMLESPRSQNITTVQECKKQVEDIHKEITSASLELEHLLRELGQVYEAVQWSGSHNARERVLYSQLPRVAAELLIDGYPLELMDGDAAHVPQKWVTAVIQEVIELLKDPHVFVLSVLGLQSTGKSTLINTTFGLQFNVGTGRCTRGAFMLLLPISKELKCEIKCDYVLVIDTEGLRAPELDAQKTQQHDKELATFVIGVANETLINIYGEVPGDMDDILQTAVRELLRMNCEKLSPSCQFIHQNVGAVAASDKGGMGRSILKDNLDRMTFEAAKEEECEEDNQYFSDVINFNEEKDIHHFPCLWKGDPPMAPVNPGYSEKALSLRSHLIEKLREKNCNRLSTILCLQITDLWNAVLQEKYVFSFINTLEVSVYNTLEAKYVQWSGTFRDAIIEWKQKAENKIRSSKQEQFTALEKQLIHTDLPNTVSEVYEQLQAEMKFFFEENEQRKILAQWQAETEHILKRLANELQCQAKTCCQELISKQEALDKVTMMMVGYQEQLKQKIKEFVSKLSQELLSNLSKELVLNLSRELVSNLSQELVSKLSQEELKQTGELSETKQHKVLQKLCDAWWKIWIKELEKKAEVRKEKIDVEKLVQDSVIEHFKTEEQIIMKKFRALSFEKWGEKLHLDLRNEHIQLKLKHTQWAWRKLGEETKLASPVLSYEEYRECIKISTRYAFDRVEHYLKSLQSKNFDPTYTIELLIKLREEIQSRQQEHPHLVFTREYHIDMALTACGYAARQFQQMVDRYHEQNDPIEYLNSKMKAPFYALFKNQYFDLVQQKSQ